MFLVSENPQLSESSSGSMPLPLAWHQSIKKYCQDFQYPQADRCLCHAITTKHERISLKLSESSSGSMPLPRYTGIHSFSLNQLSESSSGSMPLPPSSPAPGARLSRELSESSSGSMPLPPVQAYLYRTCNLYLSESSSGWMPLPRIARRDYGINRTHFQNPQADRCLCHFFFTAFLFCLDKLSESSSGSMPLPGLDPEEWRR